MSSATVWGCVAGVALGLLYLTLSHLFSSRARATERKGFVTIVVGGMLLRMAIALCLVALVLWKLPVDETAFIGTFILVFFAGLILEVRTLHRGSQAD